MLAYREYLEEQMEPPHYIGILGVGLVFLSKRQDDRGTNKVLYLAIGILAFVVCGIWVLATDAKGLELMGKIWNR